MPTFKAVVLKQHIRPDNTARLKIRVIHQRKITYIDAGLTVAKSDLTKKLALKTPAFIFKANDIIREYVDTCNKHAAAISQMTLDQVVKLLTDGSSEDIDFISFALDEIERIKSEGRKGVAKNHLTAIKALKRFSGDSLLVQDITAAFLQQFEHFIRTTPDKAENDTERPNKGMSRAPSLYMSSIRALHNRMKAYYNNEDLGVILIPFAPFTKYKLPAEKVTRKRAIDAEKVKAIMNLLDKSEAVRYNLAKDCYILSFCLIGMNSADLYDCSEIKGGWLTYKRMKTRTRRKDEAKISVKVQPEIEALVKKYKDKTGKRVFNFYQHYADSGTFGSAVNKGLKKIGEELGLEDLEFYSARHSWATIALNKVKIDLSTVHLALNHVDPGMEVTKIYWEDDWSMINDANRKVLDYIKDIKEKEPESGKEIKED